MPAIGILGGMGPQASCKLYELLIAKTARYTDAAVDDDYPEIVLLNVPVPNFISDRSKMPEAKQMLIERTKLLERAGCTINGIACNTVHILLPELQAVTSVPFVSIPSLVSELILAKGYQRVGLLATPTTLISTLYDDALNGVEIVRPNRAFAEETEQLIYTQMRSDITSEERAGFRQKVAAFQADMKLDAVILGCTELPLVYGQPSSPNIIDTLEVLSDALLKAYFAPQQVT